jgi:NADH-quinone oxidoreductase subunit N
MTAAVPAAFEAVSINYGAIAPMLVVVGGALIGVLVEAFASRNVRYPAQVVLTLVTLVAAMVVLVLWAAPNQAVTLGGSIAIDGPAIFLQGSLLLLGLLGVLAMSERFGGKSADAFTPMGASSPGSPQETAAARAGFATSEVFPLSLFAVFGMLIFVAANDLITMFVALEVLSLPLYVMTGLARRRRLLSQEASLKYFLLGAFSSAFFLFGAALLYGFSGSSDLKLIARAIGTNAVTMNGLLLPGAILVLVGVLFKVGAVPFHSWTPDAYQGAPTPVTGFMAAATKLAAFGAILRLAYVGFEASRWDWRVGVGVIAALTMIVGAVLSVTQTDMKRLLAYSSVAHAGFVLIGVLAFDVTGIAGVMFYVAAYGLSVIAAFAIIAMVRQGGSEATHLSQWAGLGRRHPVVAGVFSFLLLAFAGIPLTSGFTAKFAVFAPALKSGGTMGVVLVVIGVLASAVTAYVYFRIIVLMYFTEAPDEEVVALTPSAATTIVITVGALATLLLGVVPGLLLELAQSHSIFSL